MVLGEKTWPLRDCQKESKAALQRDRNGNVIFVRRNEGMINKMESALMLEIP